MSGSYVAYRQLLAYIDELHAGISQLAVAIEKEMQSHRYEPISNARNRGYWYLSANIDRPHGWRMKMVTRFLVPAGGAATDHSLLYQVLIDSESAFDFPTILCARLEHRRMSEARIYRHVWRSDAIATLHRKESMWTGFAEENGWCVAVPAYKSPIKRIKGYILNLLEVDSLQRVSERIVEPLVRSGDAGWRLTVEHLVFPGLRSQ